MSLIVEDGTGLANAESFCSVAAANAYHAGRGNIAWMNLAVDGQEAALRYATDYMEGRYREMWNGYLMTPTQALAWPRYYVPIKGYSVVGILSATGFGAYWPNNAVPVIVANACASLALRASAGPLAADLDRETLSEGVGGINVTYRAGAPQFVRYREIDMMLNPFLKDAGATLVRA